MNLKVGDKVRIIINNKSEDFEGIGYTDEMFDLSGTETEITRISRNYIYLEVDQSGFTWQESWLEKIEEKKIDIQKIKEIYL